MKSFFSLKMGIPGLLIAVMIAFLWKGLSVEKDHTLDQKNKPFPEFSLQEVRDPSKTVVLADLKGKSTLVHVWATWCSVCIKEHKEWINIIQKWPTRLVGVVYRDDINAVDTLLKRQGDPYTYLLNDATGTLGLHLGIIGTPETFILDPQGIIQFHHLGPVSAALFEDTFLPILEKLEAKALILTPQQQAQLDEFIKEFRCVTCPNQTIADSPAPVAQAMKEEITRRWQRGESPEVIRAFLLSQYGDYVSYRPLLQKSTWLLWGGPFVMLLAGFFIWFKFFRSFKYSDPK